MKVNISIDGTPDEVRAFFGWPPVAAVHEEWLKKVREQMAAGAPGFDPASLMKAMPVAGMPPQMNEQMQQFMTMQQAFWQQMAVGEPKKD